MEIMRPVCLIPCFLKLPSVGVTWDSRKPRTENALVSHGVCMGKELVFIVGIYERRRTTINGNPVEKRR